MKACIVCYDEEESTSGSLVRLETCEHEVCVHCLKTWLEQCEKQLKRTPQCPDCCTDLAASQVESELGRPYQALQRRAEGESDTLDEGLQTWLDENGCQQCGNCGAYIEREEGCDAVMCICGYRFCWECQVSVETGCDCGHSDFFDNIRGFDTDEVRKAALPEELIKLKQFMRRWKNESDSGSGSEEESQADSETIEEVEHVREEPEDMNIGSILDYEEQEKVCLVSLFEFNEEAENAPMLHAESGSDSSDDDNQLLSRIDKNTSVADPSKHLRRTVWNEALSLFRSKTV